MTQVIKNFVVYSFGSIAMRAVTSLSALCMIRVLSPSEFGVLALINTYTILLPVILNMGLRQAYGLEYFHHDSDKQISLFHDTVFTYIIISLPLCLMLLLFAGPVNELLFFGQANPHLVRLATLYSFLFFFSEIFLQILRYQTKAYALTTIQLSSACITAASNLLLVFVLMQGIAGALIANTLGIAWIISIALYRYLHLLPRPQQIHRRLYELGSQHKHLLLLGLPFIPNVLLSWILSGSDRWILGLFSDMKAVGIYSLADSASQFFNLAILAPLSASYIPTMLRSYSQNEKNLEQIEKKNIRTMWLCMGIALFVVIISAGLAKIVGKILLPISYYDCLEYVGLLLIGNVLFMGTYFNSCYLVYTKRTWLTVGMNAVSAICNILLNFILTPHWSIYGCVVATVISNGLFFLLHVIAHRVLFTLHSDKPVLVEPAHIPLDIPKVSPTYSLDKQTNNGPEISENP